MWQWQLRRARLRDETRRVTPHFLQEILKEELHDLRTELGEVQFESRNFRAARAIIREQAMEGRLPDEPAAGWYDHLAG